MDTKEACKILRSDFLLYEHPNTLNVKPISIKKCEEIAAFIEQQAKDLKEVEEMRNDLSITLRNSLYNIGQQAEIIFAVRKLSKELNTLKWKTGYDEGWILAVDAIKKEIDKVIK